MRRPSMWTASALAGLVAAACNAHDARASSVTRHYSPLLTPLQRNAGTPELFPMPPCKGGFLLHEATIDQMQEAMNNDSLTAVDLVKCYRARTLQTQPYINSLLQENPDAFDIAEERDRERALGQVRGPLHGIPFTVKDNIATDDQMETTAGCWALLGCRVPRDAFVVANLREAGAVLVGKAGLSEWADMRSSNYSEGFSPRGGQVRSAYNLNVNPGGSSSGSGVGVGANVVAFSIGTETDGSVINPAMRNSIVGFKPTVGLTSRAGVIPETTNQDSVGTFARTVRDAVYALNASQGVDCRDPATQKRPGPPVDLTLHISNKSALANSVFGIPWNSFWIHADDEQRRVLGELVNLIKSAGAEVINNTKTEITNYETIVSQNGWDWDWGTRRQRPNESEYTYVKVDFYNNIKTYLSELTNTNIRSLEDIVKFNEDNAGSEGGRPMPDGHPAFWSGQDGFLASLETRGNEDDMYRQALEFCRSSTRQGINDALGIDGNHATGRVLDGLLVPVDPGQSYQIAAQAGYPMITIPAGIHPDTGMGFGLGIMHTAWAEAKLVRAASAIEHLQHTSDTSYRRPLPTWRGYLVRNLPVPL